LAVAGADDLGCVAARQLATIEHRFQNGSRFRWKISESNLFLAPHQDAGAQAIRLNEFFHESHLVDAKFQKKSREISQRFFAQIATPIKIVPAGPIAVGKMAFVSRDISRETACNRPDAAGIQTLEESRV
jgi:hypothetical protein